VSQALWARLCPVMIQSWGCSLLLHGICCAGVVWVLSVKSFEPRQVPFHWDVMLVTLSSGTGLSISAPEPSVRSQSRTASAAAALETPRTSTSASSGQDAEVLTLPLHPSEAMFEAVAPQVRPETSARVIASEQLAQLIEPLQDRVPDERMPAMLSQPTVLPPPDSATSVSVSHQVISFSETSLGLKNERGTPASGSVMNPNSEAASETSTLPSARDFQQALSSEPLLLEGRSDGSDGTVLAVRGPLPSLAPGQFDSSSETVGKPEVNAQKEVTEPASKGLKREPSPSLVRRDYGWLIQSLWERVAEFKRYPREARINRWEGKVVVRAVLDEHGQLIEATIAASSGHDVLDQAAIEVIRKACPLKLGQPLDQRQVVLRVPIQYRLDS